ncbi:MAG: hypothetical protein LBJ46_10900 [Planctomycetota bacterium]|jgi:predicted MFS family arabinose efflux permease|nr:hypothetical protein [Planctomycetota bacterium]
MHERNQDAILGLFFSCGSLGGMFGPWVVGLASDWPSPRNAVGVVAALFCLFMAVVPMMVRRTERAAG